MVCLTFPAIFLGGVIWADIADVAEAYSKWMHWRRTYYFPMILSFKKSAHVPCLNQAYHKRRLPAAMISKPLKSLVHQLFSTTPLPSSPGTRRLWPLRFRNGGHPMDPCMCNTLIWTRSNMNVLGFAISTITSQSQLTAWRESPSPLLKFGWKRKPWMTTPRYLPAAPLLLLATAPSVR